MKIASKEAIRELKNSKKLVIKLFEQDDLLVELYTPDTEDLQMPHSRDEIYIIISGTGTFINDGVRSHFSSGDFFFVPAGAPHRFEKFSPDFATWVFFFGPDGGAKPASK